MQKFFFQFTFVLSFFSQSCSQLIIFHLAEIQLLFYLICRCLQFFEIESDFVQLFFVGYILGQQFVFLLIVVAFVCDIRVIVRFKCLLIIAVSFFHFNSSRRCRYQAG